MAKAPSVTSVTPVTSLGWARPWAIARPFSRPAPRAGAWYPIVGRAGDSRVVLQIRGRKVAVRRQLLEIRIDRPDRFTVVVRPKGEQHADSGTIRDLGPRYAVCPSCGSRLPLYHDPAVLMCGTCAHRGEVAWWETG